MKKLSILRCWRFSDNERERIVVTPLFVFVWASPGVSGLQCMKWWGWRLSLLPKKWVFPVNEEIQYWFEWERVVDRISLLEVYLGRTS